MQELLGFGDDEAEIGADHVIAGLRITLLYPAGEQQLFLDGEQRRLTDILEVEIETAVVDSRSHGFQ